MNYPPLAFHRWLPAPRHQRAQEGAASSPGLAACGIEHSYILELVDEFGALIPPVSEGLDHFAASRDSFGAEFDSHARNSRMSARR